MFIDWEKNIMFQLRGLALNKQDVNIFVRAQCELVNRRIKWQRSSSFLISFFFRMACPVCRSVCLRFDSFSCPAYQPPFHHPHPQSPRYALSE